jgi:hypothetical protein
MTVKEIVKEYLEKNGFDGLCSENCGCGIDNLMPCEKWNIPLCEPAYMLICQGNKKCPLHNRCEGGREGYVCYSTEKPEIQE